MNENGTYPMAEMRIRAMRVMLFFDLPVDTPAQKRAYRKFRNNLIDDGFIMLQYSVYARLVMSASAIPTVISSVRSYVPSDGIIQILTVTEKQFTNMEFLTSDRHLINTIHGTESVIML